MIKNLLQKAFTLKKNGYYKHAIETFYKVLEHENNSFELLFEIADSYFLMGDYERALEYIEQILEKNPKHIESLKLIKQVFIQTETWNEALKTSKNIYYISKNTKDLVEIFKLLNKQNLFNDVIQYNREENIEFFPDILYEKAHAYFMLNDYENAENFINKALKIEDKNTKYQLLKGKILIRTNSDELALNLLENIEINEQDGDILNFAGLVHQYNGNYKTAIEYFMKSIKVSKEKDVCYYNCASTFFKSGDISQAKKYYNLAISKNPDNPSYHLALANLYYSEKNYKRAFEELKDDFYEARLLKAIILHDSGYYAIADKEFKKLITERPDDLVIEKYLQSIEKALKIN